MLLKKHEVTFGALLFLYFQILKMLAINNFSQRFLAILLSCTLVSTAIGQYDLSKTNLPILVITTPTGVSIVNEPKIEAQLGIIWNNDNAPNNIHSPFNHFQGKVGIEIRGSSSQTFEKKGYAVETRKDDGSNLDVGLLNFPPENDWVLHGPYSDKSLMRNAIAYIMAGWIMDYAPRVRFVELVINGDYKGVYLFTEKIKRDANRVAIANLNPDEVSGDDLTGGYILKIDKWDGAGNAGFDSAFKPYPGSKSTTTFQYHFPKPEDINSAQKQYIQKYINELESNLMSTGFKDPVNGFRKYFDLPSFMQNIFIQEITKNVDGYRLSQFMYKDKQSKNNKLKMGPVWDFNLGFGNANYCGGAATYGWAHEFNKICAGPNFEVHFWWPRILEDEQFRQEMGAYWKTLRQTKLTNERISKLIDSLENLLVVPATRNFTRYNVLDKWIWPNVYVGGTWPNEVSYMRNWLFARLEWLDLNFGRMTPTDEKKWQIPEAEVFPNPIENKVTIKFQQIGTERNLLLLCNSMGQVIKRVVCDNPGKNMLVTQELNMEVPSGVYLYRILGGGAISYAGRVVKL